MIRPEDPLGKEAQLFQQGYVQNLRNTLKFHQSIQLRVNIALHEVAKKMNKKSKDITYIGIHNRRTDFHKYLLDTQKNEHKTDYEELGTDYLMDGMEYFRYILTLYVANNFQTLIFRCVHRKVYMIFPRINVSGMSMTTSHSFTPQMICLGDTKIW